ncbi:MAG: DUF433 domain-containing protein [Chloroflexi bacterium]|nr:DUF433 domain-containing protein [Dehalococcoidia bacterium]PKB82610.1 MAG: hypothetical protein BZY84_02580 [SAR202 cluster bacterium MP-SInd-SRR3963457-G1]PKB84998.1 MAG: hypothetical protein BZY86_04660 [SAR202 cluster bacterium MP-NPac-SRR3961935-G1]RUA32786.1 MAG: DUF433 domain-containing protein [Chloroflexota bacterium]
MIWASCQAVERDSGRLGGVWVFRGTRVPVSAMFENLGDGAQIAEFLEWFPGVSDQQIRTVLDYVARLESTPGADTT